MARAKANSTGCLETWGLVRVGGCYQAGLKGHGQGWCDWPGRAGAVGVYYLSVIQPLQAGGGGDRNALTSLSLLAL